MLEASIAGSLPKPFWLAETEKLWPAWKYAGEELEQAKRDAAALWIKEQEAAGLDIVCEGEQFRVHFVHGFLEHIAGIDWDLKTPMGIRDNRYTVEVPTVTEAVTRPRSVHKAEAAFARSMTEKQLKFTLPGPMTICDTIADAHYGKRADMAIAFAELLNDECRELEAAGVDVIQIDEPAFNVFMADVKEWGVAALDRAVEGLTCKTAVHICYGYGIQANIDWKTSLPGDWRQYEETFPALNESTIGQVSLEFANSRVPGELMRLLDKKDVLAGVIDVATDRAETADEVAATIRDALAFVDAERLQPCTNCGLAPLNRALAVEKLRALGAGTAKVRAELA